MSRFLKISRCSKKYSKNYNKLLQEFQNDNFSNKSLSNLYFVFIRLVMTNMFSTVTIVLNTKNFAEQ